MHTKFLNIMVVNSTKGFNVSRASNFHQVKCQNLFRSFKVSLLSNIKTSISNFV